MELKNFGLLTEEMNDSFSISEMEIFLNEKGVVTKTFRLEDHKYCKTNEKNGVEIISKIYPSKPVNTYTQNFLEEVYTFVKYYMNNSIGTNEQLFVKNFNSKTFGFSRKKKIKKGLKLFNKIYNNITDIKNNKIGDNKINNHEKRFIQLKIERNSFIKSLEYKEAILNCYLFGVIDYFDRELLDTNECLIKNFNFENDLAKLICINAEFKFEKDTYFTPKPIAQIIYEAYKDEFKSLEVVEFMEKKIRHSSQNKDMVSLFLFKKKKKSNISFRTRFQKNYSQILQLKFTPIKT